MRATVVLTSFCHGNSCYDNQCCNIKPRIIQPDSSKMAELEINNSDEIVQKVSKLMRETCGCALGLNGRPCSDQFTEETVLYNLNNCLKHSSAELDLVILANIQVFTKRRGLATQEAGVFSAVSFTKRALYARRCSYTYRIYSCISRTRV